MDYRYEAINQDGRALVGQVNAASEREVLQFLREQDLTPIKLTAVSVAAGGPSARRKTRPATVQEKCQVIRELATLLRAGVSLAEAVESTGLAHGHTSVGAALADVYQQLRSGAPLSTGLRAADIELPEYLYQLVEAGELTGKLADALSSAGEQMEYEHKMAQEMRNALIYPSVLVFSGVAATLLIFIVVVPKFANILKNSRASLPDISVWVLKSGMFVKNNLLWFGVGAVGILVGAGILLSLPAVRRAIREWASRLPIIGEWLSNAEIGRWATMLGSLLLNRVPIIRAMELAEGGVQLPSVAVKLQLAVRDLRGGKKLADSLALHKTINPMGVNLIRVGERTGELPEMLRTLGKIYENASRERMKRFLILFEPIAILIVGAIIGFIMVAIMLAITSLSTVSL